jgi:hypothetical protein
MAKKRMLCPFSGKLCKECPLYRGRHYYLCFCKEYRGYLDEPGEAIMAAPPALGISPEKKFKIPSLNPGNAIDPFTTTMKDIK